jgi:hypothetical protein
MCVFACMLVCVHVCMCVCACECVGVVLQILLCTESQEADACSMGCRANCFSEFIKSASLQKCPLFARVECHSFILGPPVWSQVLEKGLRPGISYQADEKEIHLTPGS